MESIEGKWTLLFLLRLHCIGPLTAPPYCTSTSDFHPGLAVHVSRLPVIYCRLNTVKSHLILAKPWQAHFKEILQVNPRTAFWGPFGPQTMLRIPAMYEVKNSKICNFWTFWPVIQLIKSACPILKRWYNNRIIDQNIQKCCICLMHSTYP